MKIGILTLPLHTNYGGILQAYALQTVLERMGHEVKVLNSPIVFKKNAYWKYPIRFIKKFFFHKPTIVRYESILKESYPIIAKNILLFREKKIKERVINSFDEIQEKDFDCIVVGSDQIWRPRYFREGWKSNVIDAFLAFSNGWKIKRVAYAASLGVDSCEFSESEIAKGKEFLLHFDAISVREKSGIGLLKDCFGVDAIQNLDPTFLLDRTYYEELAENASQSQGDLFCYILDKSTEKKNFVEFVAKERHFKPFTLTCSLDLSSEPIEKRILPSVESWLRGFMDAKFVITDSFHACVFSIIFRKPFVAIANPERGESRFLSLLSALHLEDNLIKSIDGYQPKKKYEVSERSVQILNEQRNKSLMYLNKMGAIK
ncbi:MAG: polysaccharide pyruvyl transferase family protein [Fibrobacteraceae bacterium]|nr:polysaccharide pyruvyl transferase family protein [Fibrobacteraceae bacterium]